jgi:hypothetical protein
MLRRLERARKGAAKYAAATEQCSRLVTTAATLCAQLRLALEHEDLGVLALFPGLRERLAAQQMRQLDKLCRVLARRAQEMRTESEEIEALAREAFQAHAAEVRQPAVLFLFLFFFPALVSRLSLRHATEPSFNAHFVRLLAVATALSRAFRESSYSHCTCSYSFPARRRQVGLRHWRPRLLHRRCRWLA